MQPVVPSPAIFAHRGASTYAPENTLAAFQLAQQMHADGIELDVHLSADHHVIVIHDNDVTRTTNGQGKVSKLNLEELRRLDAGEGEGIPTLEDVFNLIGDQLFFNIELKGFSRSASSLPEKIANIVNSLQLGDKIIYSSFNPMLLIKIRHLIPDAKLGFLMLQGFLGTAIRVIFAPIVRPWSLHPHFSSVSSNFMLRAKNRSQAVIAYTINHEQEMRRLFSLGIQGIITDDPALAIEVKKSV